MGGTTEKGTSMPQVIPPDSPDKLLARVSTMDAGCQRVGGGGSGGERGKMSRSKVFVLSLIPVSHLLLEETAVKG